MMYIEVNSLLAELLGVEDLQQASCSDGPLFSISVIAILVLMHYTEVVQRNILIKNKNKSEKKLIKKTSDPIKNLHFIKKNEM